MTKNQKKINSHEVINHDGPIIYLNNVWSKIDNLPFKAADCLYNELSYQVPNAKFAKRPGWDGKKHLVKKHKKTPNTCMCMTGLLPIAIKALEEYYEIKFEDIRIIDERKRPEKTLNLNWNEKDFNVSTRPYQQEAVKKSIKKARGIIQVATGGGKTIIASRLVYELGVAPFIFYVMTRELLYQAKDRMEAAMPGLKVGIIGDGECDIREVNVMTVQTAIRVYGKDLKKDLKDFNDLGDSELSSLKKEKMDHLKKAASIKKLIEDCKGIYFDEAHHCPARTAQEILMNSKQAFYMFGGSATPFRSDNADLMIEGLFGPKICEISASFLIRQGFLMKPDIYYVKLSEKPKKAITYAQDVDNNLIGNAERNNHIIAISKALAKNNLSVLILVIRIEHGEFLKSKIPESEFIHGKSGKKKRDKVLSELESKDRMIVIATTIADEGLDIKTLNSVIMAGGGKSPNKCMQRVGRAIRKFKGKTKSIIIDFLDTGKFIKKHSNARKKMLATEEEFNIKIMKSFADKDGKFQENLF